MMKLVGLVLVVAACCASIALVAAQPPTGLTTELALRARITQLEGQVLSCQSQMASTQQVQARTALEKEAGCSIDWNVVPPTCKPSPTK